MAEVQLAAGGDLEVADKGGVTALMFEEQELYVDVVKALIVAGANKGATTNNGTAADRHPKEAKMPFAAGANKEITTEGGVTRAHVRRA